MKWDEGFNVVDDLLPRGKKKHMNVHDGVNSLL